VTDEIRQIGLTERRAASVARALRLTRSEDSSDDRAVDAFGRWIIGSAEQRPIHRLAHAGEGEAAPILD